MGAKQKLIEDGLLQKEFSSAEDMLEVRKRLVKITTGSRNFDLAGELSPKSFAYPFNGGSDDPSVITIGSHYDLARIVTDPIPFLGCDGGNNNECDINTWKTVSESFFLSFIMPFFNKELQH